MNFSSVSPKNGLSKNQFLFNHKYDLKNFEKVMVVQKLSFSAYMYITLLRVVGFFIAVVAIVAMTLRVVCVKSIIYCC